MATAASMEEAYSARYLFGYVPHNPHFDICQIAHLKQARFGRKRSAHRSQQKHPTGPGQMLSADTLIISRTGVRQDEGVAASSDGHSFALCLRNCYSSCGLSYAQQSNSIPHNVEMKRSMS